MSMLYKYEYGGKAEQRTSLEIIAARAEEAFNENKGGTGPRVKILFLDDGKDSSEWLELIEIPTEDAPDEQFLTRDWKICYNAGYFFLRKKNGNQVFCGKTHNPNNVFERRTSPINCPVKFK